MDRFKPVLIAVILSLVTASASAAADAAEVTALKDNATAAGRKIRAKKEEIVVGDRLKTDRSGQLGVMFESSEARHRQIWLDVNAEVHIAADGRSYTLHNGTMQVSLEGSVPVFTGNAVADPRSTFIVSYDPATNVTTVVGLSGSVAVRNRRGGAERTILAREYTRVVREEEPTAPQFLDDKAYDEHIRPFAFIGRGRPESLTVDHRLIEGTAVPEIDRAPVAVSPRLDDQWPWYLEERPFTEPPAAVDESRLRFEF
jgi:hypothetical protein